MKLTTLCYLEYENCYLMLLRNKKDHDINAGKWIGVGGKFENGEGASKCVAREVLEETGYTNLNFTPRGIINFHQEDSEGTPIYDEVMYLYTANVSHPNFKECSEGTLKWIPKDEVLNLNLWEGDRLFLPRLINNEMDINMSLFYRNDELIKTE